MADVFTHFNYLHTIPEIGMKEFKTSAYVADVLKQLGYEVETQIGGATGVVAVCDSGKPGPVLGLRADMDALGTKDGGAAHLCGHDGHMAMLLAAAEEIMKEKLVRKGKLKLLFQPAEETREGALSMLKGGAVDDIEILIGMSYPGVPCGRSGARFVLQCCDPRENRHHRHAEPWGPTLSRHQRA